MKEPGHLEKEIVAELINVRGKLLSREILEKQLKDLQRQKNLMKMNCIIQELEKKSPRLKNSMETSFLFIF